MSFVAGTIAGALVAGSIYYEFSSSIHSRTDKHRRDLHSLSARMREPTQPRHILVPPPLPAAARIPSHGFSSLFKSEWNRQIENAYFRVREWDHRASAWGRRVLHGPEVDYTSRKQQQ